jgi:hypothetical protein
MSHGAPAPVRSRVPEIPTAGWVGGAATILLALAGIASRRRLRQPRAPVSLTAAWALPLLAVWLASWILPAPVYVVGRVDAPALPLLLLAAAAGLVSLSRPLGAAALAALLALAAPSLIVLHRTDTRSHDRTVAERLSALRRAGEPVVAAVGEAALHHYTRAGEEGVLLRFPSSTRRFMNWSDVAPGDRAALADDAERVADRAAALADTRGVRSVWLLRAPGTAGDAIESALRRRGRPFSDIESDYLGLRIVGFEVAHDVPRPGSSDGGEPSASPFGA